MGLLERVGRLIRANLNDLIDRAENPEKMLKQLLLDMQNQLIQVKTQVAVAVADHHLLERKSKGSHESEGEWLRKAEIALAEGREDLARGAVDKALGFKQAAANYTQQVEDQRLQVAQLKSALLQLERKLNETRTRADLLISRHRMAKAAVRAAEVPLALPGEAPALDRMREQVWREESSAAAKAELAALDTTSEIIEVERKARVEQVLEEIRKKALLRP